MSRPLNIVFERGYRDHKSDQLQNETAVYLWLNSGLQLERCRYPFVFDCDSKNYAELLKLHLRKCISEAVQKIRREGYENGWKDAKAKRRKQTSFSGYI